MKRIKLARKVHKTYQVYTKIPPKCMKFTQTVHSNVSSLHEKFMFILQIRVEISKLACQNITSSQLRIYGKDFVADPQENKQRINVIFFKRRQHKSVSMILFFKRRQHNSVLMILHYENITSLRSNRIGHDCVINFPFCLETVRIPVCSKNTIFIYNTIILYLLGIFERLQTTYIFNKRSF